MLNTLDSSPLRLEFADQRLADEVYPVCVSSQVWRLAQPELVKLALEGDADARRLCLWVDLALHGSAPEARRALRLTLVSDAWRPTSPWPPCHLSAALEPGPAVEQGDALAYRITEVVPGDDDAESVESFWQAFLETSAEPTRAAGAAGERVVGDAGDLLEALAEWLCAELRVDTVGGALRCAEFGEAGFFGPVKRVVLRRSAQADLELDATPLGEASDADDGVAEPSLILELYGDRHGAWVLYRRRLMARAKRRTEADPPGVYECDVLIADTVAELVEQAGLGRIEKRLFQSVGVLPNDTLRDHYSVAESAADGATRVLDLSAVPERSRRFLEAINTLAVAGRLSAQDLDVMLRTARLLSRANR